jgi:UDP-N-acetylglucosamine--N-acetylmuramyl-(pentapeptide) pyrophosphoryl-undecaprenol N-acetylglucosamine transferase
MAAAGAARIVDDADLTGERLFREIERLADDRLAVERMGAAARTLARPGAARRAAEVLEEAAGIS